MRNIFTSILALSIICFFQISESTSQATLPVERTTWNGGTPAGWTDTGTGTYTSGFACSGNNMGSLNSTNDSYEVCVNAEASSLIFKLKSASMSTSSFLKVQESVDGASWTDMSTYFSSDFGDCNDLSLTPMSSSRCFRFIYTKNGGNIGLDDVRINGVSSSCGITLGTPTYECQSNTSGVDQVIVKIPYTGIDAAITGVTAPVNGGTVGGSDPSMDTDGMIEITKNEGDSWDILISGGDCDGTTLSGTISSTECILNPYISELSYNPCSSQGGDLDCEYFIITNQENASIDISGWEIQNGLSYTFPSGTTLPALGTISVGKENGGLGSCTAFDFDLSGGWGGGSLSNSSGGETIELNNGTEDVSSVSFSSSDGADGNCDALCYTSAGVASTCSPSLLLPVTLTAFNASSKDKAAHLSWTTSSEIDNDYFLVEKSMDGKAFYELGKVQGNGTTSREQRYSFVDQEVYPMNYYRLKQVDFNGKYEYSKVVTLKKELVDDIRILNNRVDNELMIESGVNGEVDFQVVNLNGRVIKTGALVKALNVIDITDVKSGMFILTIQSAGQVISEKIIKI